MSSDLTDEIDDLAGDLVDIEAMISPMMKQLKDLRKAVVELQESHDETNTLLANCEDELSTCQAFIEQHHDLWTAHLVANRMEG